MPNWTSNNVRIKGSKADILAIKELLHTETKDSEGTYTREFDFDKIIPMPKELWLVSGSITDMAIEAAKTKKCPDYMTFPYNITMPGDTEKTIINNLDDLIALGNKYLDNIKKYGASTWYDWAYGNWGTKWNPSSSEVSEVNTDSDTESYIVYDFNTAWNEPTPVFEALSAKFPKVVITVKASYEDPEPWELQCSTITNGATTETWTETDDELYAEYHDEDDDEE